MSDQIDQLLTALVKAQGVMKGATKDSVNPHFRSRYADLTSCWDACRGPLSNHGLAIVQSSSTEGTRVSVTTLLGHVSGQWMRSTLSLETGDAKPQSIGSAISYGRRYSLCSMVGIAPEDDDAEAAQGRGATLPPVNMQARQHQIAAEAKAGVAAGYAKGRRSELPPPTPVDERDIAF